MHATARWNGEPRPPGRCVVVDIDGVIADASGRQHFLHRADGRRDWRGFFGAVGDDPPLAAVPTVLGLLDEAVTIVLLSARPAWVFDRTVEWLERYRIHHHLLVIRGDDDHAAATEFKRGVVAALVEQGFEIECAIDDDEQIVDMYRREGIVGLYVHSGYYGNRAP
jgi:hypothetical protein